MAGSKKTSPEDGYFLHSLNSPSATGWTLRFLCGILEYFGYALGISYKIAGDSNLFFLRKKRCLEVPTYYPVVEDRTQSLATDKETPIDLVPVAESGLELGNRIFRSVMDFHQAYKLKLTTPVEVAEAVVKAIDASNTVHSPPLLAVIKHNQDDILRQARESNERYLAGKSLSVLDGVPIAVKDDTDVVGYETNVGTTCISIHPERDATCIANLRRAGAIIIGKANMHEIGIDVTNCNPWSGTPRNPYNTNHFTGGSSGGSACAVGIGLCPIAVGADGGGSIRIPSAYCGLYGLKPTAGRISGDGAFPLAPTVGVTGPIAATAGDLAIGYALLAGPDENDTNTLKQPPIRLESFNSISSLEDVRIGVYRPYFDNADPQIVKACDEFVTRLERRGAKVVNIMLHDLEAMRVAHANTITSEMGAATAGIPRHKFSYSTRMALGVTGNHITAADYIMAAQIRTRGMRMLEGVFKEVDVIVTPTTGITAPKIPSGALKWGFSDYTTSGKAMRFIFMANLLGIPAISVPVGYTPEGLPIGMQFQAKWWNEELLLRLAHVSEDLFAAERRKPAVFYDLLGANGVDSDE
ncbi:uncharacterized protein SPPG_02016 [Spizellomyces punctatus DAOM BR117]|uniref:Amidase domain-containing protein n=1 Tax=Spizellomyces punctatus (strain DAOM BR117) TaxID=645134 RepID=A0A0L0HND1_SPIPD|nr:uncharacterized protein SPPG_02016 [Spizellomyces punctatus DAOM BR117]KND02936.1 hypothetical protein SPPG_02016 [Spizellomyces punctatus DAOM BR117]|eukprot:XP_016610975.1 hypothetical protein SPPG_02016 [Spizellomyces punctatus DAOM BR117]